MFSIGQLSKLAGVKVPTIRYYEQIGLITPAQRTEGNQRRYAQPQRERLIFIKHARELGFSIHDITVLIELSDNPQQACAEADRIATKQLGIVREKISRLARLETELQRISAGCQRPGVAGDCYVLASLADHGHCKTQH